MYKMSFTAAKLKFIWTEPGNKSSWQLSVVITENGDDDDDSGHGRQTDLGSSAWQLLPPWWADGGGWDSGGNGNGDGDGDGGGCATSTPAK